MHFAGRKVRIVGFFQRVRLILGVRTSCDCGGVATVEEGNRFKCDLGEGVDVKIRIFFSIRTNANNLVCDSFLFSGYTNSGVVMVDTQL